MGIPHSSFPYDESAWIPHYHDADDANQRAILAAAGRADMQGHDALARHLMGSGPGEDPYASYHGPFGEGMPGQQFTPDMPDRALSDAFGGYTPPGGAPGHGPFADPRTFTPHGAGGPVVTGDAYRQRPQSAGGSGLAFPAGSKY